jgi:hypothetical protein
VGDDLFQLWLPQLEYVAAEDQRWRYGATWPHGECILRVWHTAGGGYFAVVTETGRGLSVTNCAAGIYRRLRERYARHPFALAEYWPDGESGEAHVDMVHTPHEGTLQRWTRLWPTPDTNPLHDLLETWWAVNGADIVGQPRWQ